MKTREIKTQLATYGGVVFTGRQQGKTTALVELASQSNADIIAWSYEFRNHVLKLINSEKIKQHTGEVMDNPCYNPDYSGKIWSESSIVRDPSVLYGRTYYCDEVSFRMLGLIEDNKKLAKGFKGATRGGISFPITFVKPEYDNIEEMINTIGMKQCIIECMYNML